MKPVIILKPKAYEVFQLNRKYILCVFEYHGDSNDIKIANYLVEIVRTQSNNDLTLKFIKCMSKSLDQCNLIEKVSSIKLSKDDDLNNIQKEFVLKSQNYINDDMVLESLSAQLVLYKRSTKTMKDVIKSIFRQYEMMSNDISSSRRAYASNSSIIQNGYGSVLLTYSEGLHEKYKSQVQQGLERSGYNDTARHIVGYLGGRKTRRKH